MTAADKVRSWMSQLDLKVYASILLTLTVVVAIVVFGILPNRSLLVVNAAFSGGVWAMCWVIILMGAHRVPAGYLAAFCLIGGGLTTSIPSIFYEHTVVDWGSTVSRLGLFVLMVQVALDLRHKWTEESA